MALNKHFNVDTFEFEDRPKPKLWLLKPDFTRVERISGVSKLQGTFKYNNLNQLTFQISPTMFDGFKHEQVKNTVFDKIRNKYIIEFKYNNYSDYLVIDDLKEVSNDSESIQVVADSLANELSAKSMNEIEMLGSTITQMANELTKNYAPLWSLKYVDPKVKDVKRELTLSQGTVMSALDQINTQFDTVIIFDNKNRQFSFYHKDSVGTNRGLRIRENSYLKSFEDSMVSKDIITRLIPMGSEGLTIHSANPAGSDYIEDFSFFIKPFKRDANRNVIQHSDYMSDELCHALLDYDEFYETKKETIEEYTKRYTDILAQHADEDFKLKSLNAIVQRQEDRIELLKPKSEYIEIGLKTSDFSITVAKSSYYLLMLKNEGSLTNVKFDGKTYQLPSGEWTYIKIDTADFQDATQVDKKLKYKLQMLGSNSRIRAVLTRSSLNDYEETDVKKIEEKYNYLKYYALREEQLATVAVIERRMKQYENEKDDLVASMNPKLFLSDELYKEREQYVYSAIWQEDNHTDAKELYDDAIKQLKKQNNVTRAVTVGIVNFIQSLEHKHDWDKLNVGDEIVFSNKFFDKKLKAYITEMQIGFDENSVQLTLSDVFDFKDLDTKISELLAETSSTSAQVNMHKEQIKASQGKITKMTELIEGEWDANKQRVLAGNETVDIGSHGVKVISNDDPNEFVIMVGGVIAMTKDGGETFKTGVTPDGVNAETLIGKMIIGEDLWLENESGTMRFNKDGLHIDSTMFHLTTNNGDDYFENLKNKIQDDIKQQETRIKESYQREIQTAIQESVDVEKIIDTTTSIIQDTFADGVITNVEKKLIKETLSSLEKENAEYVQQIELALNHPYISDEDIIELEEAYSQYDGMYETLVQSINESIADNVISSEESTDVNEAIVNFRNEVKEILVLVQEILETTRDNQLNSKIEQSLDFTTRMNADIKDEMADLNKAFKEAQSTINDAIKDGVIDAAETETIKTALMIMKSEKQDIENRYTQILANSKLSQTAKDRIVKSHNAYTLAFIDFSNYVTEMISDGIANSTEKQNYLTKFETLNETSSKFSTDFTYALQVISQGYANDVEGKLTSQLDGMKTEITADLKDVSDNLVEFKDVTFEAFKDGILTDVELSRIKVHQEMLEREYKDVDAGYQSVSVNQYLSSAVLASLSQKRTAFTTAHGDLINVLNNIIQVGKITSSQKTQVSTGLTNYSTALAEYTKAMQAALDNISNNMASDIAAERVNSFSGVLDNIQGNINGLQSQVDNAIDTFYYGYIPTLSNYPSQEWTTNAKKDIHIGDFFLNTKTGVAYRFLKEGSTYLWKPIEDQVITDALNSAKTAQDTADGKRRVFVNTPIPPYDIGDMWVQGTSGDIMVCKVARGKNASYVTTDWGKASKYTDDSKANQVLSDLNTFKTSANQNITNLNNTVNNFQTTVVDAFDDRVIEMAEASSINHSIQLLNNEKARIDRQYTTLVNNADLVGSPKTQLTTTYNAFVTASKSLIQTIQSAIADNKIVPTEKTSVDQKFVAYRTAITNLADKTNAAIDAIIRNVSAGEANKINERFEEWKSSEFLVESDKIAQRVSGSSWQSTYLPEISNKVENMKNYVQSRGTNLITNGTGLLGTNENFSNFVFDPSRSFTGNGSFKSVGNNKNIVTDELIPVDPNRTYRMSYYAQSKTGLGKHYAGVMFFDNDKAAIQPYHVYGASKPVVTLAKDLKVGDTQVYLNSVDGFVDDDGDLSHKHSFVLWKYTDSFGQLYDTGTYSRYVFSTAWNNGDINRSTKVITLRKPFNLTNKLDEEGIFRKGHPISATQSGGSYSYTTTVNANYPTEKWERYAGTIGGLSYMGTDKFWYGTNFVKLVFLTNRDSSGGQSGDTSWFSNIVFEDITGTEAIREELYTAKDLLNKEVTDVKDKLEDFKGVTNGAFKDGIIEATEAKAIATQIQLLNNEKSDINSKYAQVYNNSNLIGNFKTNLASAKTTYDNSHASLISTINTAISDSKVNSTEKANVDTKFTEYRTSLEALTRRVEEATNSIALKVAKDAQNSANSYTNDKVDNLEIGGRNLLQSYKPSFGSTVNSDIISTNSFTGSYWATNLYTADYLKNILVEGQTYTYSYEMEITKLSAHSVPNAKSHGIIFYSDSVVADRLMTYQSVERVVGNKIKVSKTFVSPKITDHRIIAYSGLYSSDGTSSQPRSSNIVKITNLKLEKGNKVTDWTPAPEDVENTIKNIKVGGTNLLVNSNFSNDLSGWRSYGASTPANTTQTLDTNMFGSNAKMAIYESTDASKERGIAQDAISVDIGEEYIVSAYIKSMSGDKRVRIQHGRTNFANNNFDITNTWKKYEYTFVPTEELVNIYIGKATVFDNQKVAIANVKLEKGNKSSDWSPSPQDVALELTDVRNSLNTFNNTINTTFKDGIISAAEAKSIEKQADLLNNEKSQLTSQYTKVYANSALTGSAKTNLASAKSSYDSKHTSLIGAINSAISDNKITPTEKTAVSTKFTEYRTALEVLTNRIEEANIAIANKLSADATTAANNYTNNQLAPINKDINTLNSYKTTIEANKSFIEQNKNQILSSVSKSEVEATLSKVATYETSYDIKSKAIKPLLEYNGVEFNDNYSYEVVAKTRYNGYETLAVATYISKGKGKGFELTIIDEKGTTGAHPLFGIANNKPNITLYSSMATQYTVDVIYTKYMGSASNIERTNSQIKQVSDNITLSIDKVHEELDLNNMLLNSDFTSGFEGWGYVQEIYTIADKREMSINSDSNLALNGSYQATTNTSTSNYKYLTFILTRPLVVGKTYTLSFEYNVTSGDNKGKATIRPYTPDGGMTTIEYNKNGRTVYTFTPTVASTRILIYSGEAGASETGATEISISRLTLVEGTQPKSFKHSSSKNALKVNYNTNAGGYPSIISNYMNVGKGQEVSIGDELTLSAYIYVPSSAKNTIKNNIYFECATYENTKQGSNPAFMRYSLSPGNIIYDTWVRYYVTGSVPETSANGKTNYIRALLRFNATSNTPSDGVLFYYGLPQLEKGNTLTRWTPAKLDALSTEGLATKIALNPESIDIISQNLNINTDVLTIKNTKGNFTMSGDTFSVSSTNGNDVVKINTNGISIKQDGVEKMINSTSREGLGVFAYQPRFPSYTKTGVQHVVEPTSLTTGMDFYYYSMVWGTMKIAKDEKSLVGVQSDAGRINRFSFYHEKRYLKIDVTVFTDYVNAYILFEDPIANSRYTVSGYTGKGKGKTTYVETIIIDLGKPTYKDKILEVLMNITSGSANRDSAGMRIKNIRLTDYKDN
ncbi:carbohydrate binding domain-containing protein [Mammaliicoccus sp. E-M24]|uniref:carbohydrate binding domain-containing protein n=1 Tax=Mammaliicoccus sp. E-M24 TaxID=2898684 RepID=UPI001EFC2BFD|nr:carbohydrate binding domain-containing protein [Mammaliicoccus sp. E-M24]